MDATNFQTEQKTGSANLNAYVSGVLGFITEAGPTICGGKFKGKVSSKCHVFTRSKTWTNPFNLQSPRIEASVIQIDNNKVDGRFPAGFLPAKIFTREKLPTHFYPRKVAHRFLTSGKFPHGLFPSGKFSYGFLPTGKFPAQSCPRPFTFCH